MTSPPPLSGPPPRGTERFKDAERVINAKSTIAHMLVYFSKEKFLTVFLLIVVSLATLFGVLAPAVQSRAVDAIAAIDIQSLPALVATMFVLYFLNVLCQLGQGWISAHLSCGIVRHLRDALFGKIIDLPIKYIDTHPHGDLMSRMTNDIENVSLTISEALPSLVSGVLTLIGTFSIMMWFCWQLTLLSMITIVLTAVSTGIISVRVKRYSRERQTLLGHVNATVEESVNGFQTVIAFNRQGYLNKEFCDSSDALAEASIKAESLAGIMGPIMNCIGNIGFVIIAAFGGYFALEGIITIGVISAFIVYAKQFTRPIGDLARIYGQLQSAMASAERVFSVLDEPSEDMEGDTLITADKAVVTFDHVKFSYEAGVEVLPCFSLTIPAGKKIALVGATGSGKTTVVNLLERFYDPQGGTIAINGQPIAKVSRKALREDIAIVLQDSTLITGTVEENLRYANPDATMQQLKKAVELSCCADLIYCLPEGFNTVLESGGAMLSEGQRQLLSIARAFVADPKILILDEATSNVDTRTERSVQAAMQHLMRNRTSIVIAHRLSTIQDADVIVVMDKGCIKESGTHKDLLAKEGIYARLYKTQFLGIAT